MNTTITRTAEIEQAREVDTRIAEAWGTYWKAQDKVLASEKSIRMMRSLSGAMWAAKTQAKMELRDAQAAEAEALRQAAIELDKAEFKGWTRFFYVQHIHSSLYCSSFRPTTRVGWLPDVSGLTEAEAVAQYGHTLCTKCFSSAPVEGAR